MCRSHWTIKIKTKHNNQELKPWCLTMIDPVTGWFEMMQINNKTAAEVVDVAEKTWFTYYP